MFQKISQRLCFTLAVPKNEYKKPIELNFKLSLLSALIGIFLLPHLAYLSTIAPEEIIALTNKERKLAGLNGLTANQLLTQAAAAKGKAILAAQIFKHNIDNKKFSSWIRDTGYNYSYVGENLAIDFLNGQSIVEAWKNSALHRKNLLNPYYQEIGVAAIQGKFQGQDTTVVVQIFGAPAVNSIQPLAPVFTLNLLNSNINFSATGLDNYQTFRVENLLSRSIINQELPPARVSKLTLLAKNNLIIKVNSAGELALAAPENNYLQLKSIVSSGELNNFIVRPGPYAAADNFLIIFTALTLIYFLAFLHYYYFFKINRLVAA